MKGFIIIIALSLPVSASFALSLTSGHSTLPASTPAVRPAISARSVPVNSARSAVSTPSAPSAPTAPARDQSLLARVTVYWASGGKGSDRYTRQHKCATGLRLRSGHCAVDPRHIPYGSRVVLADGTTLAAVDTGTAVKNRKAARKSGRTTNERNAIVVDRFFETKRQALSWAKSHPLFMPVKVVSPNRRPVQSQQPQQKTVTTNSLTTIKSGVALNSTAPIMKALPVSKDMLLASNQRSPEIRSTSSADKTPSFRRAKLGPREKDIDLREPKGPPATNL